MAVSCADELSAPAVRELLGRRGLVAVDDDVAVEPLSGGVSGEAVLVRAGAIELVLKRPRERLAVAADWRIDPDRAANEARCLQTLADLAGSDAVPVLAFYDEPTRTLAMQVAPAPRVTWKSQLLGGDVSLATAGRVGTLLGRIHRESSLRPELADRFGRHDLLRQGRTDPYHRAAAARHPELAAVIEHEARRLEATRFALVLGDVSPKNIFAYPDSVMFFDVEIAHWGDPAFDVAFCLALLVLKSLVVPGARTALGDAIAGLWRSYEDEVPRWPEHEAHVMAELGCILVARIDGKSPVEYITDEATRQLARVLGAAILLGPIRTLADLHRLLNSRTTNEAQS